MVQGANPYDAPKSVIDERLVTQPVEVFSVSGRIGRVRYIAWGFGLMLLILVIGGMLSTMVGPAAVAVLIVMYIAIFASGVMLTIQRCHDFDVTGWFALVYFIPLVNLVFWFIPGTDGPNRFGNPTPPNGRGAIAAATALPFLGVIAIFASISGALLDAYNPRAKVAEVMLSTMHWRHEIVEHHARTGKLAGSAGELFKDATPENSPYSTASLGADGVLTLTLNSKMGSLEGKTLVVQPQLAGGKITGWDCTGGTLDLRHRPGTCRRQ